MDFQLQIFFLGWFADKISLYLCSTLFNTRRLKEVGGFQSKTNVYQDVVAYVLLAARFGRIDIQDVKASFREHASNMGKSVGVSNWCEDSLYSLDIMCDLVPENKDLIMHKGMTFFCKNNYRYTAAIKSPMKRFSTYLMVYKKFNYCYSPIHFIYATNVKPRMSSIKRKVKKTLLGSMVL